MYIFWPYKFYLPSAQVVLYLSNDSGMHLPQEKQTFLRIAFADGLPVAEFPAVVSVEPKMNISLRFYTLQES